MPRKASDGMARADCPGLRQADAPAGRPAMQMLERAEPGSPAYSTFIFTF
jgi:hypothetical protein